MLLYNCKQQAFEKKKKVKTLLRKSKYFGGKVLKNSTKHYFSGLFSTECFFFNYKIRIFGCFCMYEYIIVLEILLKIVFQVPSNKI